MSEYDVTLQLFGEVASEEALMRVLDAASEAEFGIDWGYPSTSESLLEEVRSSVRSGQYVTLVANEIGQAVAVREACRNVGISYLMEFGEPGADGYDFAYSWRPDLEKEFFCNLDGGKILIPIDEMEKAAEAGVNDVRALAWEYRDGYAPENMDLKLPSAMLARPR